MTQRSPGCDLGQLARVEHFVVLGGRRQQIARFAAMADGDVGQARPGVEARQEDDGVLRGVEARGAGSRSCRCRA